VVIPAVDGLEEAAAAGLFDMTSSPRSAIGWRTGIFNESVTTNYSSLAVSRMTSYGWPTRTP
jgi:hypothetical protein